MKYRGRIRGLALALMLAFVPSHVPAAEPKEEPVGEEKSLAELKAENEALRRENQRLRRELVRQQKGEPVIALDKAKEPQEAPGEKENGKARDDGGFWLATKTMKRHNSTCRYYKLGQGRACKKDEGEPCKKCGG